MATEDDVTAYEPDLLPLIRAEAVRVMRAFGFAGAHVVIIGGLVPSLLVPRPEDGLDPHVGTRDLDLCLTVALVEGNVGEYERLEQCLRGAGFHMALGDDGRPVSWRWQNCTEVPITIEFFCPPGEGHAVAGRLFRPGGVVGGKLCALVLAAGRLIDRDTVEVSIDVDLPDGGGRTRHVLKVAGPAAYLASKADALRGRNKPKDAYDIVWLLECWHGGQRGLADVIRAGPIADELAPTLGVLREEFSTVDAAGAVKYGRFMARDTRGVDQMAQRAVGAVAAFLAEVQQQVTRGK